VKIQPESRAEGRDEPRTVQLKFKKRIDSVVFSPARDGGKLITLMPVCPGPGATVINPFVVCGTFDFPGDLPEVSVTSDIDGGTFGPECQVIPPPPGVTGPSGSTCGGVITP
jgi:hypothetical protein